jgi:hypothetical protein
MGLASHKGRQLRDHYEYSMGNGDLISSGLHDYARWNIDGLHTPKDNVRAYAVSTPLCDIVQSVVNNVVR